MLIYLLIWVRYPVEKKKKIVQVFCLQIILNYNVFYPSC